MSYVKQQELGLAGLALLRKRLTGDKKITKDVLDEIFRLTKTSKYAISSIPKIKAYSITEGYKAWATTYDSIQNLLIMVEEPAVRLLIKKFSVGNALDAACGTGRHSKYLNSLGHEVTGVDISPKMLVHAKTRVPEVKYIQGNINNLPLEKNSMDLAICSLALTHMPSINQAILELSRVVHSGGHIILSDIHPFFVLIGGQAEFQNSKGKEGFIHNYVHLHNRYLRAFNKAGLKINSCKEIPLKKNYIKSYKVNLNLGLNNNTVEAALEGLPLVLVWILEKT